MVNNMSKVVELSVFTTHQGADLVCDLLWNYTDEGVTVLDFQDVIDLEKMHKTWDYIDDEVIKSDKRVIVKVCFPLSKKKEYILSINAELQTLKANSELDVGSLETLTQEIDPDDWKRTWKERFKPIKIDKITVVPGWIKYDSDDKTVKIGTDSAFGTGEHETTSMCVELLCETVQKGDTVLDVGCGSGILGISAEKLGAGKVIMTDLDESAVDAAKKNVKINKSKNCEVYLKDLLSDNTVKGNIIVANIMAEILIAFSKDIGKNLLPDGKIILSGILNDRADKVISAYESAGFSLVKSNSKGEWTALLFSSKI